MHEALCIDENMILSIWDVARNHKFNYSEKYCEGLDKLLEGEASTLSSLLDSIGRDI
jgi:hypothetical protein